MMSWPATTVDLKKLHVCCSVKNKNSRRLMCQSRVETSSSVVVKAAALIS